MNAQRKAPISGGSLDRLTLGVSAANLLPSKQIALAMTLPLYTQPIKSRKPIVFINALVSLKHCEIANLILLVALQERQKQNQNALPRVDHGLTPD
ncbi:MAG: hypothetical protein DRQ42_09275, partial [Gammaproteobacteria bacterium]